MRCLTRSPAPAAWRRARRMRVAAGGRSVLLSSRGWLPKASRAGTWLRWAGGGIEAPASQLVVRWLESVLCHSRFPMPSLPICADCQGGLAPQGGSRLGSQPGGLVAAARAGKLGVWAGRTGWGHGAWARPAQRSTCCCVAALLLLPCCSFAHIAAANHVPLSPSFCCPANNGVSGFGRCAVFPASTTKTRGSATVAAGAAKTDFTGSAAGCPASRRFSVHRVSAGALHVGCTVFMQRRVPMPIHMHACRAVDLLLKALEAPDGRRWQQVSLEWLASRMHALSGSSWTAPAVLGIRFTDFLQRALSLPSLRADGYRLHWQRDKQPSLLVAGKRQAVDSQRFNEDNPVQASAKRPRLADGLGTKQVATHQPAKLDRQPQPCTPVADRPTACQPAACQPSIAAPARQPPAPASARAGAAKVPLR